jgi:hypothetical protein
MSTNADLASLSTLDALTFTVEALTARPEEAALTALGQRLAALLEDHAGIEADGRALRRAVLRATAQARVADAALDAGIAAFAKDLLALGGEAVYAGYFVEGHDEVIALGLDTELPQVALIVAKLDADASAPSSLRAHLDSLRAGLRLGTSALANRGDAYADLGRHEARVVAWRETAASALRSARRTLVARATNLGLAPTWVDTFFS